MTEGLIHHDAPAAQFQPFLTTLPACMTSLSVPRFALHQPNSDNPTLLTREAPVFSPLLLAVKFESSLKGIVEGVD